MPDDRIADPANPFNRASFYLEQLKYGLGPKKVEPMTLKEHNAFIEALLRGAAVGSLSGAELNETLDWYADTYVRLFRLHPLVAKTVFADGVMHGIAFATGLAGEVPE